MCKQDTKSVKVAPKSVLSNRGKLEGTHLTRFSPGGGGYLRTLVDVRQPYKVAVRAFISGLC